MATSSPDIHDELLAETPEDLREQALLRLKKRRDLKAHAVVYTLVNLVFWAVWVAIGVASHTWWPWPLFITLFWGVGLAMNAWDVFLRAPITESELQREIDRLRGLR